VREWAWRTAFAAGVLAVAWVSLLPPDDLPQDVQVSDKVVHALAYAVLGALAVLSSFRWPAAIAAVVVIGLLLEIAQGLSGYRSFEWADLLADAVGATVGALAAAVVTRRSVSRSS
jgi:VanZ family protein